MEKRAKKLEDWNFFTFFYDPGIKGSNVALKNGPLFD
jgi:hypothetical protein